MKYHENLLASSYVLKKKQRKLERGKQCEVYVQWVIFGNNMRKSINPITVFKHVLAFVHFLVCEWS